MAGALTTVQLQAVARGAMTPLPLEELQQLAAVFGMVIAVAGVAMANRETGK
jgi:carboxyl-terminal processing protease